MTETQGRMTGSWTPGIAVLAEIRSSFPHVHPIPVIPQFRDYHMDPSRNRVRTRGEWERNFLSWCARREEQWLVDHSDVAEERFDPITGMPKYPKKMKFHPSESEGS